jgi:hypothetical protein
MEDAHPKTLAKKPARFQFSLRMLLAMAVGSSVYLGLVIAHPNITLSLTLAFMLAACLMVCFLKGYYWLGIALMVFIGLNVFSVTYTGPRRPAQRKSTEALLEGLSIALARYEGQFQDFPASGPEIGTSSAPLFLVLQDKFVNLSPSNLRTNNTGTVIVCAWGSPLFYQRTINTDGKKGYVLIAAGPDGFLGGKTEIGKGFTPDNSDWNGDGTPDHEDNILVEVR